jgi:hypothetical protein
MTFTFVTEKAGSTVIEQFPGRDVWDATRNWYRQSQTQPGRPLFDDHGANPVTGARNVWCRSGIDPRGVFYRVHIVATHGIHAVPRLE